MVKKRVKSKSFLRKTSPPVGKSLHKFAHYAFFIGIGIAVLLAIIDTFMKTHYLSTIPSNFTVTILVLFGTVVGLFNLKAKETIPFLVASIALMLAGIVNINLVDLFGLWENLGNYLRSILSNIVVFVVPAAIIVGLKTIWKLASD